MKLYNFINNGGVIWNTIKLGLANKKCFKIKDKNLWKR